MSHWLRRWRGLLHRFKHPLFPSPLLRRGEKGIVKDHIQKLGWVVQPRFQIGLHSRDKALLEGIKNSLRVGKISKSRPELIQLIVQSLKELETVINHFQKFPLLTKKRADLKLLIMIVEKKNETQGTFNWRRAY